MTRHLICLNIFLTRTQGTLTDRANVDELAHSKEHVDANAFFCAFFADASPKLVSRNEQGFLVICPKEFSLFKNGPEGTGTDSRDGDLEHDYLTAIACLQVA
jgi:hypothetical protein